MRLFTAGLIIINNKKVLLAYSKNKNAFYLPGGKIDAGETAAQALQREIKEELNLELKEDRLKYFGHITAPAYGEPEGIVMEQDCFLYEPLEAPQPYAEIAALKYFESTTYALEPVQVPGIVILIERLQKDGLLT